MNVLAVDIAGTPRKWIGFDHAILYHAKGQVAWSLGEVVARYRGGHQRDGHQSVLETPSIIAIRGQGFDLSRRSKVNLTNRTLFGRDRNVCAYCGDRHTSNHLSRDHIVPQSLGGADTWLNCVTACQSCNHAKGSKTLSEAGLELLYVPYEPNWFESMILQNRHILADQMEYLMSGVPKTSRIRQ